MQRVVAWARQMSKGMRRQTRTLGGGGVGRVARERAQERGGIPGGCDKGEGVGGAGGRDAEGGGGAGHEGPGRRHGDKGEGVGAARREGACRIGRGREGARRSRLAGGDLDGGTGTWALRGQGRDGMRWHGLGGGNPGVGVADGVSTAAEGGGS